MITIFNRAEVYIGSDPAEFARVRAVLARNGIEYKYDNALQRAFDGRSRPEFGSLMGRPQLWRLYVKRADHEQAKMLIAKRKDL